jgi:hypothetical protein
MVSNEGWRYMQSIADRVLKDPNVPQKVKDDLKKLEEQIMAKKKCKDKKSDGQK